MMPVDGTPNRRQPDPTTHSAPRSDFTPPRRPQFPVPLTPYARAFEVMLARLPARQACRTAVEILALAHERACEAELADVLDALLEAGRLPDMAELRARFMPDLAALPGVVFF